MRRCDRQRAFFLVVVVGRQATNILHFLHDDPGTLDDLLARSSDSAQALALARKQLQSQLLLEQLQLFADPRLRRIEPLGRGGYVQPVVDDRQQVFELL